MNKSKIKKYFGLAIITVYLLLSCVISAKPVAAYTGSIGVFPALTDGPNHVTVTNIDINTESQNPAWVTTNLNYVQSVVIETNPPVNTHLLIKEYPSGDTVAFSFIVNQPFQDALVRATVYFWGPDVASLQIYHQHSGAPDELINATKIEPVQRNADNNVLWSFTTYSFSDFYLSKEFFNSFNNNPGQLNNGALASFIFLGLISFSSYFVLRKN